MNCFTIGHSNHTFEDFLGLLKKHNVDCVVDVRSAPYSKYAGWFNKREIQASLGDNNVQYIFMGQELGGKRDDQAVKGDDGAVDFNKVVRTKDFQDGIDRVVMGLNKGFVIALMCAEKEPTKCHRFFLVSNELSQRGVSVTHILSDGESVSHEELEARILEAYGRKTPGLFRA